MPLYWGTDDRETEDICVKDMHWIALETLLLIEELFTVDRYWVRENCSSVRVCPPKITLAAMTAPHPRTHGQN